ncbi:transglycosylase [Saccharothrix violaceirubra]|uniref:Putative membrane protein YeaQ/YmgE (Transglycosylase-associated protein family) n=1 Tax=Saccharothrix violaceirubra TaxID=413306 RepID=A0A7W7T6P0_9PSEU|nr:GlsB/YeaQ/YmgE family stress response membrane protein [Saccharothrix violaceirubra]MBB4967525.1 putative membrane protein YeaQ/YmgE (transglycosylase-associated protein family) [Saccharothrix violaceirubra]
MSIESVIGALVIGLVIGYLGKLVAPGRQDIPVWLTLVVGIVAAFLGTFVARLFGVADTAGIDWLEIVFQVILAGLGVTVAAGAVGRRRLDR